MRATDFRVMGILDSFVKCSGSEIVLLPRNGDSVIECRSRSSADVLVGFGEGGRLHIAGGA